MSKANNMRLAAFQHADSFFPSGAVSFSWGLETMCNQGLVSTKQDLHGFIRAQLINRWSGFERPALVHAHAAARDFDKLEALDWLIEAQTLAAEQRDGSQRMGTALLTIHSKLMTPGAQAYRARVHNGQAAGHLPVAQGLVWSGLGFDAGLAQQMAAHGLCTSLLGAAIRLAVIGHVDAQQVLAELHPLIEEVLSRPVPEPDALHSFVPQTDIASMNHETDDMRLFAN